MTKRILGIAAVVTVFFVLAIFAGAGDKETGAEGQDVQLATAAAIPEMINYQGVLTDGNNNPLDTTVSMTFTIYDAQSGGMNLWTETHGSVAVAGGLFTVLLGSTNPISETVFDGSNRWLGLEVGGDPEMARERLASVPYAYWAGYADEAGGVSWSDIADMPAGFADGTDDGGGGGIGGSGTANYIPRFTASTTLGNSAIYESGGNIGIGTENPTAKLDVTGRVVADNSGDGSAIEGMTSNYFAYGVYGENTVFNTYGCLGTVNDGVHGKGSDVGVYGWSTSQSHGTGVRGESLNGEGVSGITDGGWAIRGKTSTGWAGYFEGPKNYFSGDVGIGTDSPSRTLHVVGDINADGYLRVDDQAVVHTTDEHHQIQIGSTNSDRYVTIVSDAGEVVRVTADGNVGIGTTSPDHRLVVKSSGYTDGMSVKSSDDDVIFRVREGSDGGGSIYVYDPNGNSTVRFSGSSGAASYITSGNVGIGTENPSHPLHMGSGARCTAGGVWTNASSIRYKENVADLSAEQAMEALECLNPVTFNYRVDKEEQYVGFIAEEVPDLVATNDREGLSPMDLIAVLTKVVQEQQKTIEELKTEITLMKAGQ